MSNGCHNRIPLPNLVPLPTTYTISIQGHHVVCEAVEMVPFVFKKPCQYTLTELGQTDKGCIGCTWRKE